MFDWNDEELTNIIWGEAGESDDHIVPYPDQIEEKPPLLFGDLTKKETNQDGPVENKTPTAKSENRAEPDASSKGDLASGFDVGSWLGGPEPSSSNVIEGDQGSMGTTATNSITKSSKHGSSKEEMAEFDKKSEKIDNPLEDGEQVDFVDYSWANIGSFDDLDRIFSNNDPIFGDMSVGNTDELWSSSKDVSSSPLGCTLLSGDSSDPPLGPSRTSSDRSDVKVRYTLDTGRQSFISSYEKLNEIPPQDVQASIDTIEYSGGKSKLFVREKTFEMDGKFQAHQKQIDTGAAAALNELPGKGNKQKRLLKGQKLEKKNEARQLHDWSASGNSFQQVNNQYAPVMVNSGVPLVLNQPSQLPRPEPLQQKHFASSFYGNMVNYYPTPSVLPQFHPGEGNHDVVSSGYDGNASSLKKPVDASVTPPPMTPREKIEKLRRRQQMRAILAIQKQQQQFGNQVAGVEHPTVEGEVDENLSSEQDDSNTVRVAFDNCSVEESVLYRLQETIAKLDVRIRLCIRDSLIRLAQSAMQRQYPNDTGSTNTSSIDEIFRNKDIDESFPRMPDVETDTNPIDRTVAHLLFHRPLDFSGKPADTPESPVSAGLSFERKDNNNSLNPSAKGYFPESFENAQLPSPQGSKPPGIFSEGESSACLNMSEINAPKNEAAEGAGMPKIETSEMNEN